MSQPVLTEAQLHQAVEQLRSQHSNTLDLYKAVAALLFFQYDSTPTTNRMYQLVRKGSMSAPAEALKLFWKELRDRSQVRMEQADIPPALTQSASLLIAQLWEESMGQAQGITEKNNQAIYEKMAANDEDRALALQKAEQAEQNALHAAGKITELTTKQEALIEEIQALKLQVATQKHHIEQLDQQKKDLQAEQQTQQNQYQQRLALSEQRAADMEKYARLEIERARQDAQKAIQAEQQQKQQLQKDMQALTQRHQDQQKAYVELQQQYRYQTELLQTLKDQHQQLELKNQDLHDFLQKLQQQLASNTVVSAGTRPSRLARRRALDKSDQQEPSGS